MNKNSNEAYEKYMQEFGLASGFNWKVTGSRFRQKWAKNKDTYSGLGIDEVERITQTMSALKQRYGYITSVTRSGWNKINENRKRGTNEIDSQYISEGSQTAERIGGLRLGVTTSKSTRMSAHGSLLNANKAFVKKDGKMT